ncbi:hypothetical protein SSX86_016470 [Deinandra increscens subsp. villosa]|uniref:Small ribosomal subunit protein uS15 N-terminal domain-containing protein n=1 Tax=Deinandra increscens subsp. villosa TaxID=3103831 RepID=A0AAP0D3D2_9ASTR
MLIEAFLDLIVVGIGVGISLNSEDNDRDESSAGNHVLRRRHRWFLFQNTSDEPPLPSIYRCQRKGISASAKPYKRTPPSWLKIFAQDGLADHKDSLGALLCPCRTNCIRFFVSMTAPLIGTMALETVETNLKVTGNLMRFILAGNLIGLPAISVAFVEAQEFTCVAAADPTCDDSELPPSAAAAADPTCVLFSAYQSHPKVQMNNP